MMSGRFLRFVSPRNAWVEISEEAARIKVAQAFQYRQRRGGQIEGNQGDHPSQKLSSLTRKRTADTVQATWHPVINLETHRTMQSFETLSVDTQITTDEILWALGMEPSLPENQRQHHISDSIHYGDDLAIGRPATTVVPQMQGQYEVFHPTSMSEVADHNSAMQFSSMLASAATRTESTATSLLQAQLSHQAGRLQAHMLQEAGQTQHLQHPIAQLPDVYVQQNPLNTSNMLRYSARNPNPREIVPHGYPLESQGLHMPLSMQGQQSFQRDNETEVRGTIDAFLNINSMERYTSMNNQQSPTFDYSFTPSPEPSLHQVRSNTLSDTFPTGLPVPHQNHDHSQLPIATTRLQVPYHISSLEPNELLLEPLPLDDNESSQSFGKQDENAWRSNGPP